MPGLSSMVIPRSSSALYYKHTPPHPFSIFPLFSLSFLPFDSSPPSLQLSSSPPIVLPSPLTSHPLPLHPPLPPSSSTLHNVKASRQTYRHLGLRELDAPHRATHLPLTLRVSTFHRPAPGVSSPIAISRIPSPNAPTSQ